MYEIILLLTNQVKA